MSALVRPRSRLAVTTVIGLVLAVMAAGAIASARAPRAEVSMQRVVSRAVDDVAVLSFVRDNGGVHRADGSACPRGALVVSYDEPDDRYGSGAYVKPLGASDDGRSVNGVVLCEGSYHAFVGFAATLVAGRWDIALVPDPEGAHTHDVPKRTAAPPPAPVIEDKEENRPDTAPVPPPASVPMTGKYDGPEIEGYARYEGQETCDPAPKPGTVQLRNLLLAHYPVTTSFGIDRACEIGGRSEHKEGRAFDWGANINVGTHKAAVQDFFDTKLFAADRYGNAHAMARRMGVMYVIWNARIWMASRANWQPYEGTSPHTDHVHLSLSWAGARAQTSFWSGKVVKGLPDKPYTGDWHTDDDDDDWENDDEEDWKPPIPWPTPKPTVTPTPTPVPTPTPPSTSSPSPTGAPTSKPSWTPPPWWHHD